MSGRARRDPRRGQALVEFALVFPIIALLAFGFIDVGRAVFTYNTLTNAARQAARVAAVNQVDPVAGPWGCLPNKPVQDPNAPEWTFRGCALTAGATAGVQAGDVTISYAAPPGSALECTNSLNVGCIATVTVVTHYIPITPVAGSVIGLITMTATSQMPIERLFPVMPHGTQKESPMVAIGRSREAGQALVVMVGVMLLSIAMLAVIVDGGNVLNQQRIAQTGADSTAEAGAVVFAERLAGATVPASGWDAEVANKIAQSAAANNVAIQGAYYTDICGIPLKADGTAALNPDGTENLGGAAAVGNGLPGGNATAPDCPSLTVGPVAGVMVLGHKDVGAYVARAIGIPSFAVTTRATAVAGYLQGYCAADQGQWCAVLPVTIPVNEVTCDGSNDVVPGTDPWVWDTVLTVPLCKNNPGNVGWLDWTPPGGGASELVCSIVNPNNPAITLPSWQYVAATGNTNGGGPCTDANTGISYSGVEDAIRKYNGQIVLIPQFDYTCRTKNSDPNPISTRPIIDTGPLYGCPNPPGGGNGQNIWYRMPSFAFFQLCDPGIADCTGRQGAYIQGNNKAICDTGNGATSCLVGKFTDIMGSGTVGPGAGSGTGSKALGVQLIK